MNSTKPSYPIFADSLGSRFPLEVTAVKKNKVAHIAIKGSIYEWSTASSRIIEPIIAQFKEDGITEAVVYIKTPGGDVFEANEMLNLISDSFTKVTVKAGALVASAGTRFCAEFHTTAKSNSKFMIHKPMGNPSGNEDQIESKLKLIKDMTEEYREVYAKKMGITKAAVEKLWAKGDCWMTAKEALKKGLIDAIEDEDENIDANTHMQLVACGAPNIPEIKNETNQKQKINMELSVLAVSIGLPSTATQPEVDAKLEELKRKAGQADGLVQAAADKKAADEKAAKKAILDNAELDKKLDPSLRAHYETMAIEALTEIFKNAQSVEAISEQLNPGQKTDADKSHKGWTYADYQDKNPEAFEKLDEATQTSLIEAHYKEQ